MNYIITEYFLLSLSYSKFFVINIVSLYNYPLYTDSRSSDLIINNYHKIIGNITFYSFLNIYIVFLNESKHILEREQKQTQKMGGGKVRTSVLCMFLI